MAFGFSFGFGLLAFALGPEVFTFLMWEAFGREKIAEGKRLLNGVD
jgi:hypothetical protein